MSRLRADADPLTFELTPQTAYSLGVQSDMSRIFTVRIYVYVG